MIAKPDLCDCRSIFNTNRLLIVDSELINLICTGTFENGSQFFKVILFLNSISACDIPEKLALKIGVELYLVVISIRHQMPKQHR